MPFNHTGNTANGNAMGALRDNLPPGVKVFGATLFGRTTNLPIYEVAFSIFQSSPLAGANLVKVVTSIEMHRFQLLAENRPLFLTESIQLWDIEDRTWVSLTNISVHPGTLPTAFGTIVMLGVRANAFLSTETQ